MNRRLGLASKGMWCVGSLITAVVWAAPSAAQVATPPAAEEAPTENQVPVAAPVENSTLTVQLQPVAVTIGDRIEATLRLDTGSPPSSPPRFPFWESHWGQAEIVTVEPPVDLGSGVWTQRLELAIFETGDATLPGVQVEIPRADVTTTAISAAAIIQVDSVLPSSEEEVSPQPPAPVLALPAGRAFWWAMVLLAAACLALGYFVLRSARRISAVLAALALSPMEAFQGALVKLRAETGVERVYTGLSLELRRYLGRALGFPAAEGTTTQIQRSLRERQLPAELVRDTLGLLREADQIKFARGAADRARVDHRLDDAERLASGVERWLEPVVDEAGTAESEAVA